MPSQMRKAETIAFDEDEDEGGADGVLTLTNQDLQWMATVKLQTNYRWLAFGYREIADLL